jgi:hypothetical protein
VCAFGKHESEDVASASADHHPHADFARPLSRRKADDAVDADRREDEGECGQEAEETGDEATK